MAITTSPYQQNDYQAANTFRPYALPVNDIMQGLSAQNQFWEQGARQVKAYYDNAMGLNLTLASNNELRKEFMQKAEKELTKLSSMNLSDPSVQRKGASIFKPLMKDKGIIYDDFITNKKNQIFSEAEKYKKDNKTKGEGYHTDNLMYALRSFKDFNENTSREQLEDIVGKVQNSEYIPYHDVSKEYMDIAAKCKPDKMTSSSIDGLYLRNQSDNSQTAANLQGCLKAGLSDKAWQQLRITGSVRLGEDYQTIGSSYSNILLESNVGYANNIVSLEAQKAAAKKLGKLDKEVETAYDEEISNYKKAMFDNQLVHNRLQAGDYSDIEKNYDNIVSQVWANQDIGSFAQAFAYKDESDIVTANAAGIAQMRENNENIRFQMNMQMKQKDHDIELIKSLTGGKGGNSILGMEVDAEIAAKFYKPIYERLGIPYNEGTAMLDKGTVVEGAGQTIDGIKEKVNEYHNNRVESAVGITNVLKQILPPEALKELYNEKGQIKSEKAAQIAEQYLNDFYKSGGGKIYNGKMDKISALENLVNEYSTATSNVSSFIKMRDQINQIVDKNPEIKTAMAENDEKLNKLFEGNLGKTAIVQYDPSLQKGVIFYPDDLKNIIKGNHPTYQLKSGDFFSGDKIVNRNTGQELDTRVEDDNGFLSLKQEAENRGFKIASTGKVDNPWSKSSNENWNSSNFFPENPVGIILDKMSRIANERREKVTSKINPLIQDVVKNTTVYNVGSVPGLGNTIKKELSYIPELNSSDIQIRPGIARRDEQGNVWTSIEVYQKNNKKEEGDEESFSKIESIRDLLKNSPVSVNGANNIRIDVDGNVSVKTNSLPMAVQSYELQSKIENDLYLAKKQPLAYQEAKAIEVRRIPNSGGFKVGFDIVGGRKNPSGSSSPSEYRIWFMKPDGEKLYINEPVYTENQIGNKISALEQKIATEYRSSFFNKTK